jgi:primosomal protein N' (replication factor Y)
MFAQVVFNLPIEGPFDYLIPSAWEKNIKPGMRVRVSFGRRRCLGYVVGKARETQFNPDGKETLSKTGLSNGVKPILGLIDHLPVLDKTMLRITQGVARYYACCWGEAIEAALPLSLRRGRRIELSAEGKMQRTQGKRAEVFLLQDLGGQRRWEIYFREIEDSLNTGRGVIFLTPDIESAQHIQREINNKLNVEVGLLHSYYSARQELAQWIQIKQGLLRIVVGTRMAIFAPVANLGLIIIEEEQSSVYKQDSTPHYNAVGVGKIRNKVEGAKLILSSRNPPLETWYQAKKGMIRYILRDAEIPPCQIKLIDLRRVGFFPQRRAMRLSISLEDAINKTIERKGRVLLFLNRRGFAIFAHCQNCGTVLRCPRCNANLILHFKENKLVCHQCNYKIPSPRICPNCKSGYIRYSGLGTEKLESELARLYPQVNIACMEKKEKIIPVDAQIVVATESIFKCALSNFDLIGVISPDAVLNRPDFRAGEKLFDLLLHLACLAGNSLIIQTNFPQHYCFQALAQKRIGLFYETELSLRRESHLPPFNHIIVVNLRGRKEEGVSCAAEELFNILNNSIQNKSIKIISYSSAIPHKRRDKFYEQILIKARSVPGAVKFLKRNLSNFRRSGIIVTVDVDPL